MTDTDRTIAHGMGYESAVDASAEGETHTSGTVAAPGHEEALADLAAENERLRAGMRVLIETHLDVLYGCPVGEHWCLSKHACGSLTSTDQVREQSVECWCKWALAEADAKQKAGGAQ